MRLTISLFIALCMLMGTLSAQNEDKDQKLLVKFTVKELAQMRIDEPEMIDYWNYYADARCMQVPVVAEGLSNEIPEVEFDLEEVNYLSLDLEAYHEKGGQVRVAGTDVLLVIKPEKMFLKELGWQ